MLTAKVTTTIHLEMLGQQHTQALTHLTQQNQAYLAQWLPWAQHYNGQNDTVSFIKQARQEWFTEQAEHYVIF